MWAFCDLGLEAAERQAGVEKHDAALLPLIEQLARWRDLQLPALDVADERAPGGVAVDVAQLPGPRVRERLDDTPQALGDRRFRRRPFGQIALLERAPGGAARLRIGVLSEHDRAHPRWLDLIERAEHISVRSRAGRRPVLAAGKIVSFGSSVSAGPTTPRSGTALPTTPRQPVARSSGQRSRNVWNKSRRLAIDRSSKHDPSVGSRTRDANFTRNKNEMQL